MNTVDPKCYAFAQAWLAGAGYTWSADLFRLAEEVQEIAEEFMQELHEQHDPPSPTGKDGIS